MKVADFVGNATHQAIVTQPKMEEIVQVPNAWWDRAHKRVDVETPSLPSVVCASEAVVKAYKYVRLSKSPTVSGMVPLKPFLSTLLFHISYFPATRL